MENEENYYDSFEEQEPIKEPKKFNIKLLLIILGSILLIGLIVFLVILIINKSNKVTFNLEEYTASIYVGDTYELKYNLIDKNNTNNIYITVNDDTIASIDENIITGLSAGETTINIVYIDKDENDYTEVFYLEVLKKETTKETKKKETTKETTKVVQTKPTIKVTYTSGTENKWNRSDVKVKITATDTNGISTLKYTLNSKTTTISSGKTITISNNGKNKITIVATNKQGNSTSKTITVLIDKNDPTVTMVSNNTIYYGTKSVQVCAKCSDSESGCIKDLVCQVYDGTGLTAKNGVVGGNNISFNVYDNVNNYSTTSKFSFKLCSGTVTASLSAGSASKNGVKVTAKNTKNTCSGTLTSYFTINNKKVNGTETTIAEEGCHSFTQTDIYGNTTTIKFKVSLSSSKYKYSSTC